MRDPEKRRFPFIQIPSHQSGLARELRRLAHSSELENRRAGNRPSKKRLVLAMCLGCVLMVALATVLAIFLPVSEGDIAAKARGWYAAQETKGRWEHAVIYIDTQERFLGPELTGYIYEMWRDTGSGDVKAQVKDPRTGKVLETMISIKQGERPSSRMLTASKEPRMLPYYVTYTDKPDGQPSLVESWWGLNARETKIWMNTDHTAAYGILGEKFWSEGPGAQPFSGEYTEKDYSPLEFDSASMNLLSGQSKDLLSRGFLQPVSFPFVKELGERVMAVSRPKDMLFRTVIDWEKNGPPGIQLRLPGSHAKEKAVKYFYTVIQTELMLDPETCAYRGITMTVTQDGKLLWANKALYERLEFTDASPNLDTAGMRVAKVWQDISEKRGMPAFP